MSWATGVMVYLVIWWTVLFAVLPLGVKRVENPGRGQEVGSPERPQLVRKAIITSIVGGGVCILFSLLPVPYIFSFRVSSAPPTKRGAPVGPPLLSYPETLVRTALEPLSSLKLRPSPKA